MSGKGHPSVASGAASDVDSGNFASIGRTVRERSPPAAPVPESEPAPPHFSVRWSRFRTVRCGRTVPNGGRCRRVSRILRYRLPARGNFRRATVSASPVSRRRHRTEKLQDFTLSESIHVWFPVRATDGLGRTFFAVAAGACQHEILGNDVIFFESGDIPFFSFSLVSAFYVHSTGATQLFVEEPFLTVKNNDFYQ